jgi:hypothetical protein
LLKEIRENDGREEDENKFQLDLVLFHCHIVFQVDSRMSLGFPLAIPLTSSGTSYASDSSSLK